MACQSSVTQKGASPTSFFGSRLKINSFDPSFGCIVFFLGFLNEQEFLEFEWKTLMFLSIPSFLFLNATPILFFLSPEFMEIEKLSTSVSRLSQG